MIEIDGVLLPEHVSHSQITTWLSCGHKYFLSKVAKVFESQTWWLAGGVAVHEATEAYDLALWEAEGR
jgi:hypothetical protein